MSVSSVGTCSTDWWFWPPWFASRSVIRFAGCRSRIAWGTLRQVLCYWQVLPPHIQPRLLSVMRAGNNLASLPIFFLHFSRNGVLLFRNKLRETITCRPILSGGCELSHGFAVIDLSLEQPERAQGFLDTCLYRNRSSNLLVIVDTPSAVLFCRPNTCGPDIGLPGRRERGEPSSLFSPALNACSILVLVEFLTS